jgi:hypothetical protein
MNQPHGDYVHTLSSHRPPSSIMASQKGRALTCEVSLTQTRTIASTSPCSPAQQKQGLQAQPLRNIFVSMLSEKLGRVLRIMEQTRHIIEVAAQDGLSTVGLGHHCCWGKQLHRVP